MARTLRTEMQARSQAAARRHALLARRMRSTSRSAHADAIQKLANVKLEFRAEAAPKAARHALHRAVRPGPRCARKVSRTRSASAWRKRSEQLEKNIANSERQLARRDFLGQGAGQGGRNHPRQAGRIRGAAATKLS